MVSTVKYYYSSQVEILERLQQKQICENRDISLKVTRFPVEDTNLGSNAVMQKQAPSWKET